MPYGVQVRIGITIFLPSKSEVRTGLLFYLQKINGVFTKGLQIISISHVTMNRKGVFMSTITLESVSKVYDDETTVFKDINLAIEPNEFFVLVGPSGCGKSTLLRLIAGLEAASSGKITIFDKDVTNESPQNRKLSMVFQNYALFPHMTVKENILFGLADKKISEAEQAKRLNKAVELTNLEKYLDKRPKKLSGGQRQRVALARAIASKQPITLMDEPLSNLDAKLRESMRTQIKQLQRELNMSIVYVTHDQTEAMTMGDRIALLNEGLIQQIGSPLELYNSPKNVFVASFIGTPKINLFHLTAQHGFFTDESGQVQLPIIPALHDRTEVIVAIRPEHLKIVEIKEEAQISGKVLNVEQLGNETLFTLTVGKVKVRFKVLGQLQLEIDDEVFLAVDQKHLHYFNSSDETRLLP